MCKSSPLILLFSLVIGCGGGAASEGGEQPDGEATSGGDTTSYEGEIASTDVAAGQETFETFCGDCHPDGGEDVGPSLIDDPHSPARTRQQIREGSGRMRPFSSKRLSDAQVEDILAWLNSVNAIE